MSAGKPADEARRVEPAQKRRARVPFRESAARGAAGAGGGAGGTDPLAERLSQSSRHLRQVYPEPKDKSEGPSDVLAFGSCWIQGGSVPRAQGEAAQPPARGAKRRTNLETRTLNRQVPIHGGYRLRGRWLAEDYNGLRNAAWAVRNSRVGKDFNPLALRLVLAEAEGLTASGEPLYDVLEAFAELLSRP